MKEFQVPSRRPLNGLMRRLGRSYTSRPESSTAYNKKNDEKEQAVEGQGRKKPAVNMGSAYNKEDE